ncbi:MAG: hypothetical protein DVB25_08615 [Verrucomicrobia bacterium]|nr:MAG: hypothetical protein DVB25_08615 [Verrucomicrobiota bacterium]
MTPAPPTRAYPLLLLLSTAVAAIFCLLYIIKPNVPLAAALAGPPPTPAAKPPVVSQIPPASTALPAAPVVSLLPDAARLPGDSHLSGPATPTLAPGPRRTQATTATAPATSFEETNLHIQHILTATTPSGDLTRIVLNVPVLYQSRKLAWTEGEVAESRALLKRLSAYQENSRALREEAAQLLAGWNHLVEHSMPTLVLRADSPSLPANQDHAEGGGQAAGLDTSEAIQLQPADK